MGTLSGLLGLVSGLGEADVASAAASFLSVAGLNPTTIFTQSIRTAFPYIYSGVSQGLSANAIQKALSAAGLGVRRENLLTVVGMLRTQYGFPSWIQGKLVGQYPAADLFRFGYLGQEKAYSHVVKFVTMDSLTGHTNTNYLTVTSDTLLSNEDLGAAVDTMSLQEQYGKADTLVEWDTARVWVSPTSGGV
jgi:hypothetical protein